MKKLLFQKVFEKAEKRSGKTTKNGLSDYLSDKITYDFKYQIAGKTFVRYYEKYIEGNGDTGNDPKTDLLDALSRYLKYEDFGDFVSKNRGDNSSVPWNERIEIIFKKNKVIIVICLLTIIAVILIVYFNKQRWMVWEENQYIEVPFDAEKYDLLQLKLYNADRIAHFKQIFPDCNTKFFNDDGSANVWYGKSAGGELEYFTALGKHPETGKTLKEITDYMINTHICPGYKR